MDDSAAVEWACRTVTADGVVIREGNSRRAAEADVDYYNAIYATRGTRPGRAELVYRYQYGSRHWKKADR